MSLNHRRIADTIFDQHFDAVETPSDVLAVAESIAGLIGLHSDTQRRITGTPIPEHRQRTALENIVRAYIVAMNDMSAPV